MEKFDFSRSKYYIFVIFIAIVFVACVAQAFNYLPENNGDRVPRSSVNVPSDDINIKPDNDVYERRMTRRSEDIEDIDIDTPPLVNNRKMPDRESSINDIDDMQKYNRTESTDETSQVSEDRTLKQESREDIAESYYEQAINYAKARRYGTALAYAQKSYNMNPTTEGEVLLARLYYKTGDYNKANDRMNNILKRDFSADK